MSFMHKTTRIGPLPEKPLPWLGSRAYGYQRLVPPAGSNQHVLPLYGSLLHFRMWQLMTVCFGGTRSSGRFLWS